MKDQISRQIRTAAEKTIETMTFAEVFPEEEIVKYNEFDSVAVHLHVLEPYNGSLGMQCSKSFISFIAENLFAIPGDDISEKQLNDLLYELINTISGSFLSSVLPSDVTFKLGLPESGLDKSQNDDLNIYVWNFKGEEGNFTIYGSRELIEKL